MRTQRQGKKWHGMCGISKQFGETEQRVVPCPEDCDFTLQVSGVPEGAVSTMSVLYFKKVTL